MQRARRQDHCPVAVPNSMKTGSEAARPWSVWLPEEGRGSLRQAADAALTAAIRAIHVASVKDRVTRAPSSFNLPPSLRFMPSLVSYDVVAASAPTLGLRRPRGNHWGRLWGRLDRFPHAQGFRTPRAGLCGTRNFPQELPLPGSERVRLRSTRTRPVDRFP